MRVLVIGGGITGLTAAWALLSSAREGDFPLDCLLVERASRLGGKILTESAGGCLVEAGPEAFISLKPAATELCEELGIGHRVIGTRPEHNRTYILRNRRLHTIPGGMATFLPTDWREFVFTRLVSWPGKIRMGLEYFLPARPRGSDESMESFFCRRLGREAYSWLIEPLLSGIYAGDGSRLGLAATFPRYLAMERQHGGLVRAALAARSAQRASAQAARRSPGAGGFPDGNGSRRGSRPSGMFLNLQGGLGELTDLLTETIGRLGGRMQTGVNVASLVFGGPEATVRAHLEPGGWWDVDAVVMATPAFDAADLVESQDPRLATRLREIPYASTATVSAAFDEGDVARRLDGYGFVVPRGERMQILASTWTSSKWEGRAPRGTALLRCYLGGDGREEILQGDDDQLLGRAMEEVGRVVGLRSRPRRAWVHRWERAMPQYLVGHRDRVLAITEASSRLPGLHLAGSAYHGIGIPDCIADGRRVAADVLDVLRRVSDEIH